MHFLAEALSNVNFLRNIYVWYNNTHHEHNIWIKQLASEISRLQLVLKLALKSLRLQLCRKSKLHIEQLSIYLLVEWIIHLLRVKDHFLWDSREFLLHKKRLIIFSLNLRTKLLISVLLRKIPPPFFDIAMITITEKKSSWAKLRWGRDYGCNPICVYSCFLEQPLLPVVMVTRRNYRHMFSCKSWIIISIAWIKRNDITKKKNR